MKYLKMLGLAAVAAMALTAFGAGTASATTLATSGTAENASITIEASIKPGTSAVLRTTGGLFANTCTESNVLGKTVAPFTKAPTEEEPKARIGGPIETLTFKKCSEEEVKVDENGELDIEWISGTTNGTVRSKGAKVTVPSPFGKLTCTTGAGTDIGTLTGVTKAQEEAEPPVKHATMDINGVINCGIIPSALWQGTYTVTGPTGLGVES
ncbi:MAG TPA: hypothetical protein VNS60_13350 [Solirubrobacterales bacterium]|nr:hypothetical protein [Solirubrobacterales bacterium]